MIQRILNPRGLGGLLAAAVTRATADAGIPEVFDPAAIAASFVLAIR